MQNWVAFKCSCVWACPSVSVDALDRNGRNKKYLLLFACIILFWHLSTPGRGSPRTLPPLLMIFQFIVSGPCRNFWLFGEVCQLRCLASWYRISLFAWGKERPCEIHYSFKQSFGLLVHFYSTSSTRLHNVTKRFVRYPLDPLRQTDPIHPS